MNKYSRLPFWFKEQDKPEATIRIVEGIYKKAQLIQEFPEIDYRYVKRNGHADGYPRSPDVQM